MSVTVSGLVWANGPTKASDRLMLLALADNADDYGLAWPGMARLAEKCCVQPDAARATVRRLEADGWITVVRGGGTRDGVHGLPNRYQMDLDRLRATPPSSGGSGVPTPPPTRTYPPVDAVPTPPSTGGEPSLEPSEEPSLFLVHDSEAAAKVGDPLVAEFAGFWQAYPKRVERKAAEKAYRKARKTIPMEVIAAGLRAVLPVWASMERQYVPNPATWLNGERWADEVQTASAPVADPNAWMMRR